jgi:hypothetical protein
MLASFWQPYSTPQAYQTTTQYSTNQSWCLDTSATHLIIFDFQNLNLHWRLLKPRLGVNTNRQWKRFENSLSWQLYSFLLLKILFLNNVVHVPHIKKNLLSIYWFRKDNNAYFEFHPFFSCVKYWSSGAILLQDKSDNGLYPL